MNDPSPLDDETADHDRFERELVAQDLDASRVSTADIDRGTAHRLVHDLIAASVVTPVPDQHVLIRGPSGEAFDSIVQLAVFHRGWTAARDAREEAT